MRLGDFLLCVEMALASLAHAAVFPAHEHSNGFYRLNDPDDASKGAALVEMDARDAARNMFALNDIMRDFHRRGRDAARARLAPRARREPLAPQRRTATSSDGQRRRRRRLRAARAPSRARLARGPARRGVVGVAAARRARARARRRPVRARTRAAGKEIRRLSDFGRRPKRHVRRRD